MLVRAGGAIQVGSRDPCDLMGAASLCATFDRSWGKASSKSSSTCVSTSPRAARKERSAVGSEVDEPGRHRAQPSGYSSAAIRLSHDDGSWIPPAGSREDAIPPVVR
jgi:hypothetical protein